VVRGRLWQRGEGGVGEGQGVVEVDKSSVKTSKNRRRLVVRPGEGTAKQRDLQDTKVIQSEVEGIHKIKIEVAVVFVIGGPNEVEVPKDEPRARD
jgi:hypothetical protein